jgi:hypothetical protein
MKDMMMSDAVQHLMDMNCEVVSAKYIAPILKMSESVIVKYAKDGTWDADRLGNYVVSGGRVKFFRKDFLQKCGFIEKKPDEQTDHQLLKEMVVRLKIIQDALLCMMNDDQRINLSTILNDEKTASCCNN